MFFPKGIITISEVLDKEGKILTHQVIKDHHNLDSFNFLDYIRLSTVIFEFTKRYKIGDFKKIIGPIMPTNSWMLKAYYIAQGTHIEHYLKHNKMITSQKENGKLNLVLQ